MGHSEQPLSLSILLSVGRWQWRRVSILPRKGSGSSTLASFRAEYHKYSRVASGSRPILSCWYWLQLRCFLCLYTNVKLDCAPAYILESETRNQLEHLVSQHLVYSSAWSSDVSQVSPDRDKNSNCGDDAFITQNLNFYRKQYEQVINFWKPDPTNQVVVLNIIDDVSEYQLIRTRALSR